MKVKICSGFNDKRLEQQIQLVIDENTAKGLQLKQVSYSISPSASKHTEDDANCFLKSAILFFDR
ncbi:MAG: hypothetical protein IJT73_09260 [Selenomonadaceae bacterium]|nr:hypothetical protein [Selenomonadaceae bacterium]